MRRVLFGAFLFLAACGGDLRGQSPGAVDPAALKAERARFLLTAAAQQAIADIARTANQDALDTCLNAWVEDVGGATGPNEGPVSKPNVAGLRGFLIQCLAGSVPGDLRAAPVGANGVLTHESTHIADRLRIDRVGDARGSDIPVAHPTDSSSPR
jgi:hypothetical protein